MIRLALCLLAWLALAPSLAAQDQVSDFEPTAAADLLALRAFSLQQDRPYPWMKDHAPLRSGLLLALDVDPLLARPRQVAQPVLYVGAVPAEILNVGYPSGRLLALVPGAPDLAAEPIYFGAPDLPERIDGEQAAGQLAAALGAGLLPFGEDTLAQARAATGAELALEGPRELELAIADFIDAWAPDEAERAESLRAPAP